ncbi:MAG TPA: restriction endonuclease [Symbiobacteriaceae bacterium]|nr:restriction endonuclease [Symbiobacteriaceae bacterium]
MGEGFVYLFGALGILAIPLLIWVIRRIQEEQWKERAGLGDLGALSDAQFEAWVEGLFNKLGYRLEQARGRESLGVDWILTDPHGYRTALQTRRWRQTVGPEAVEQIVGGAVFHRCDERLVISTAPFTSEAKRLGRQTETRLWGIRELAAAMEASGKGDLLSLTRRAAAPGPEKPASLSTGPLDRNTDLVAASSMSEPVPNCPRCGKPMVKRSVNGRPVMVCAEFPRCTGARVEK